MTGWELWINGHNVINVDTRLFRLMLSAGAAAEMGLVR